MNKVLPQMKTHLTAILLLFTLGTAPATEAPSGKGAEQKAPLLMADFESGDLSTPISWEVARGEVAVKKLKTGEGVLSVASQALVVSPDFKSDDYTVEFKAIGSISTPLRFVFLYQDANNYYSVVFSGKQRGLYRTRDGKEDLLDPDAGGKLAMKREAHSVTAYKVHIRREPGKLDIEVDRGGNEVDYEMWRVETDPAILSAFAANRIGLACDGEKGRGEFDDILVSTGKLRMARTTAVYYIDAASGNDERSPQEAGSEKTPWKTIGKAASAARPGDEVRVLPGTYREVVVPECSGERDAPIVFRAADPAKPPVINGADALDEKGWTPVEITDFRGNRHQVLRRPIDANTLRLYQDGKSLMIAQEPNQPNGDTYGLAFFRPLPPQASDVCLTDPTFLNQTPADYWKGATLLLSNNPPGFVMDLPILASDPVAGNVQVKKLSSALIGGPPEKSKDRYAIMDHLGLLDQPGEFFIDRSVTPFQLYVMPYPDRSLAAFEAVVRPSGFHFLKGGENIVVDGFVVRYHAEDGVNVGPADNRGGTRNLVVRNCDVTENGRMGIGGGKVRDLTVEKCLLRDNARNGIAIGSGDGIRVLDCDVKGNGQNGITMGSGTDQYYNVEHVLIRNCRFSDATGKQYHPDNYQMHQVSHVIIEGCVFIQSGDQNGWCQYSDDVTLRNNIFVGGRFGMNCAIHSYVYHNVFWDSTLRYDAHLDDHPIYKDYYKPQEAVVRNNLFVNCAYGRPKTLDCDKIFTSDHNIYVFPDKKAMDHYTKRGGHGEGTEILIGMENVARLIKTPPGEKNRGFDFHSVEGSLLIDAGVEAGVKETLDGQPRPVGKAPDIGPYERQTPP